ncbi:MAG: hypothetical protein AAB737_02450 [Patescibacteria group bacterium]
MARTSHKRSHRKFKGNLEMYAFWTGFASTLISLLQVVVIAARH